ncbi:hypothetical protein [Shewanella mangrovisoli]|uniref:hypothetical protein n=1 Tax=Shewanella mangrovisoli TaxID=2864211 RepID=UPI0035B8B9EE
MVKRIFVIPLRAHKVLLIQYFSWLRFHWSARIAFVSANALRLSTLPYKTKTLGAIACLAIDATGLKVKWRRGMGSEEAWYRR